MVKSNSYISVKNNKRAFTLAEVLITLVIIGIVAALTIGTLSSNNKDKEYNAARQKILLTIGQAGRSMAINGTLTNASNTKDFVENYFSKYVKIAKTCERTNLEECGIPDEITTLDGNPLTMPKTIGDLSRNMDGYGNFTETNLTSYGLTLINGYAINLFFNPKCRNDNTKGSHHGQPMVCINAIYDMNGLKEPNKVGKDIGFVSVLYPNIGSSAVAPNPFYKDANGSVSFDNIGNACSSLDDNLFVPTRDELLSMFYNNNLIGMISSEYYWSSNTYSSSHGWGVHFNSGNRFIDFKTRQYLVRCVQK